ncbi:hypothetical protein CI238_13047 [Colletotrichum incanum]|uniref:Uncharacterized protein n=1 Tax=Colletotrichum incanum TaxID=1573173 RepID=A0A167EFL1_COLIC|nr:hypothetical protein CI238_13047 [Colletotrichum incanum]
MTPSPSCDSTADRSNEKSRLPISDTTTVTLQLFDFAWAGPLDDFEWALNLLPKTARNKAPQYVLGDSKVTVGEGAVQIHTGDDKTMREAMRIFMAWRSSDSREQSYVSATPAAAPRSAWLSSLERRREEVNNDKNNPATQAGSPITTGSSDPIRSRPSGVQEPSQAHQAARDAWVRSFGGYAAGAAGWPLGTIEEEIDAGPGLPTMPDPGDLRTRHLDLASCWTYYQRGRNIHSIGPYVLTSHSRPTSPTQVTPCDHNGLCEMRRNPCCQRASAQNERRGQGL